MNLKIMVGDWVEQLKLLPDNSIQCCVTSPPYWGLRDYGVAGQLGLEKTPEDYVTKLVEGFHEVHRVLRDDGTLWVNLGDSYAGYWGEKYAHKPFGHDRTPDASTPPHKETPPWKTMGLKPKDLIGIPWRVAFALQADGWWLRSEITWCKKVPMPESVMDRPTSATEKVFLLAKSAKYFYDADAVRNPPCEATAVRLSQPSFETQNGGPKDFRNGTNPSRSSRKAMENLKQKFDKQRGHSRPHHGIPDRCDRPNGEADKINGSNMRNYWVLGPEPYAEAHFATFPTEVPRKAILAGSKPGDMVLDPFGGSGTTGQVAIELGRRATLIELNPDYAELIRHRCNVTPGLPL